MRTGPLPWLLAGILANVSSGVVALAQPRSPAPAAPSAPATPAAPPQPMEDAKKSEARSHFENGLAHIERQEWSAALAEFLKSRELFPTRAATKDAAICLRKEGRFDEALDMYERLLADFPDLSDTDRVFATREMQELRGSIGTIDLRDAEPGATVVVDGRERGAFPLPAPLRVGAGSHNLRVYKEGFVPFETRVDVVGRQAAVIGAHLGALVRGGRLRVTEQGGRTLDVVVDSVIVGKTPTWEGTLAAGEHTLFLRGDGNLGTPPATAPVRLDELTQLTLNALELDGMARVDPTPVNAIVSIDGVTIGRGVWDGKLRVGAHVFEVAAEGFLPFRRELSLESGKREVVVARLERDPTSPLWAAKHPPRFVLELAGSGGVVPSFGGDVAGSCTGGCSQSTPFVFGGVLRGGYELGSGLGLSVDAGYLSMTMNTTGRSSQTLPVGTAPNNGTVDDSVRLSGLSLGLSPFFHRGDDWPLTLRAGVGVFLASARDARAGTFTNSYHDAYSVDVNATDSATYVYLAPEARIGRRIGEHFELSLGIEARVFAALKQPRFSQSIYVTAIAPNPSKGPTGAPNQGDGRAFFPSDALAGTFLLAISPSLGARYDF